MPLVELLVMAEQEILDVLVVWLIQVVNQLVIIQQQQETVGLMIDMLLPATLLDVLPRVKAVAIAVAHFIPIMCQLLQPFQMIQAKTLAKQ